MSCFMQVGLSGWTFAGPPIVGKWAAGLFTMIDQFKNGSGEGPFNSAAWQQISYCVTLDFCSLRCRCRQFVICCHCYCLHTSQHEPAKQYSCSCSYVRNGYHLWHSTLTSVSWSLQERPSFSASCA